jgi:DNA-binding NarL/FixJ family response regulator
MEAQKTIRVVVVDDHDVVRRGLAILIRAFDDLDLIGSAANGLEAVDLAAKLQPDVMLMDMIMPEMDGIEATRLIHEKHPGIQVVALTSSRDDSQLQAILSAGAVSFLSKNTAIDDLVASIRAAHARNLAVRPT